MQFNSIEFLLFFLSVSLIYFLLPHSFRWFWLLAASCYFYSVFIPYYLLILLFTILIDYFAGIKIEVAQPAQKKAWLILSLAANLSILAFFKYYNFFIENIYRIYGISDHEYIPMLEIILPLGLSFHTFQAMSYTIEIYRGNQNAERNIGIYALYVLFYPQLVAGPIERPQNILHQFHEKKTYNHDHFISGIHQMLWGLFKKAVVGDLLGKYVDSVYNNYELHNGTTLLFASFAFTLQVYCDFSGYSDIAIGSARTMGFHLMDNFNLPLFSKNISEFWRRWHISLSTWFNDYVYSPFILKRRHWGINVIVLGVLLTFALSGLWHGAAWTFVIYGLLNGIAVVFEILTRKRRSKFSKYFPVTLYKMFSVALTFSFFTFTLIFFRAENTNEAFLIIQQIFNPAAFGKLSIQDTSVFASMTLTLLLLFAFEFFYLRKQRIETIHVKHTTAKSLSYMVIISLIILLFGVSDGDQFIYFQF